MSLRLAGAPAAYSQADQTKLRADLTVEDKANHKRGQDIEAGRGRLILIDRVSGVRYQVVIDAGVLGVEAMP